MSIRYTIYNPFKWFLSWLLIMYSHTGWLVISWTTSVGCKILKFPFFLSFSSWSSVLRTLPTLLCRLLAPPPPLSETAGLCLGSPSLSCGLETQVMWSNHRVHVIYFLPLRDQSLLLDVQCLLNYLSYFPPFFSDVPEYSKSDPCDFICVITENIISFFFFVFCFVYINWWVCLLKGH